GLGTSCRAGLGETCDLTPVLYENRTKTEGSVSAANPQNAIRKDLVSRFEVEIRLPDQEHTSRAPMKRLIYIVVASLAVVPVVLAAATAPTRPDRDSATARTAPSSAPEDDPIARVNARMASDPRLLSFMNSAKETMTRGGSVD